jgi:fructose-1,6-bisphosphate aldolase, class II
MKTLNKEEYLMVLVSAKEMIEKAHEGHYAIGAFNINNMEWTKAILAACQQANSPVILQVSEGAAKYMCGFKQCADMVKNIHDHMGITVPVALHLDHGTFEGAKACIEAGFTSVMFDGSHYDFAENLEKSKEIIKLAHSKGVSVECEVGGIGGTEDGVTSNGELADPKECAEIAALGVDFLAAGIGNIHGVYPADWAGLNFERLAEIDAAVNGKPLVLHGGSGIPFDQVHKAITMGVSKINVNTDLQIVFAKATREYIEAGKDQQGKGFDPRKLLKPGADAIVAKVIEMVNQFGSVDKA